MFNLHSTLNKFYDDHVRLSGDEQQKLADYRDKNIERLKTGLTELNHPKPKKIWDQGSYAMNTINQDPDNEYDIDTALVFDEADLPDTPLKARRRIGDAMAKAGGNFKTPPEVRTNAVTVWYAEGHHVDLVTYRQRTDQWGNIIYERAGAEWREGDPRAVTDWFNTSVNDCSPKREQGALVDDKQLRREVRLLKALAKNHGNVPGGFITTILAVETYRPNTQRDDQALYDTMVAMLARLQINTHVWHPVETTQEVTCKQEYLDQVERLRDVLEDCISKLSPLFKADCTEEEALRAWGKVFKHSFWDDEIERRRTAKALSDAATKGQYFVGPAGRVSISRPDGQSVQPPPHRFYGED